VRRWLGLEQAGAAAEGIELDENIPPANTETQKLRSELPAQVRQSLKPNAPPPCGLPVREEFAGPERK
jgi:hypothetical protein